MAIQINIQKGDCVSRWLGKTLWRALVIDGNSVDGWDLLMYENVTGQMTRHMSPLTHSDWNFVPAPGQGFKR